MKKADFENVFPIRAVEHNAIVSKYGDITVVFEVSLPEIFTLSAKVELVGETRMESGDFRDVVESWGKAIAVLPDNTIIHKQDCFTEEKYRQRYDDKSNRQSSYLDKASARHFNERPYLNHVCYVYITKTHNERKDISSVVTTLAKGRIVPKEINDSRKLDEFFNTVEQFASILTSSRVIGLRRLGNNELAGVGDSTGIIERYMSLELNHENKVVPLSDLRTGEDFMVGDRIVKFYSLSDVEDMPEVVYTHNRVDALSSENSNVAVGFASPVNLMLNVNHIYNQYIFKEERYAVLPKLEQRATQMKALASFSKNNESNARLINEFLETAADTGYTPVRCHFNIMVWTSERSMISNIRNLTTSAISRMGMKPRENSPVEAMSMFWAGIPGNAADMASEEKFQTFLPQACSMLNMESTSGDASLSMNGVRVTDRLSGKPLYVDFSDEPVIKGWISNRNKFILGPSGSGKSFLTNHFLRSYYMQGSHMVIVDVGDSYEGLCSMMGGKYLTYKPNNPISFNPFYIDKREAPDIEKIEAIKALLLSLWKKETDGSTRIEDTMLALAVSSYFKLLEEDLTIVPCFNTFFEHLNKGFKALLKEEGVKEHHFDYNAFLVVMRPFYKGGEYDYLLNSTTNLDLTNERFVVFELDNIKDNKILFPVVTIMIMDTFLGKMRKLPKDIRKIILIEEAWKAIMKQEMAEYIKYLYKTVRKHFGEAWIVTQEVDDIINSPIVRDSIINNADTRILMDQRKYQNKFGEVQRFLALTDQEKNLALSLNRDLDPTRKYKEFFASFAGQHAVVYGLEVSRAEYFAFTTEGPEKMAIKRLVNMNGGNYDLAIRTHLETLEHAF